MRGLVEIARHADGRSAFRQGTSARAISVWNARAPLCRVARADCFSQSRQVSSVLSFAARSEAEVAPPLTLTRFSDSRMPCVGIGARLELSVRELTPIQAISDDSLPYSIFGQRFITTLMPAAYAFAES